MTDAERPSKPVADAARKSLAEGLRSMSAPSTESISGLRGFRTGFTPNTNSSLVTEKPNLEELLKQHLLTNYPKDTPVLSDLETTALANFSKKLAQSIEQYILGHEQNLEQIHRGNLDILDAEEEYHQKYDVALAYMNNVKISGKLLPTEIIDFKLKECKNSLDSIHKEHLTDIFIASESNKAGEYRDLSIDERLEILEQFARKTGGVGIKNFTHELFRWELATEYQWDTPSVEQLSPLPVSAPIRWKDREPDETAPDFARRVYGQWLKDGMSKRALRKLDAALVNELNTWVRNGNEMPADIRLLTVGEENQRLLDAGPDAIREHLGKFTGMEALREAERLRGATRKR